MSLTAKWPVLCFEQNFMFDYNLSFSKVKQNFTGNVNVKNGSPLFVPSPLSKQAKGDFGLVLIILYLLSLKLYTADISLRVRLLTMSVVERADCTVS